MTKFEEELNKIEVEVQTPLEKYIVEKAVADESLYAQHYEAVLEKFKDWHSDEEFQELKKHCEKLENENSFMRDERTTFDSNGTAVEPIIQQQSLPVVPEDVDEAIKYLKNHNNSTFSDLGDILTNKGFKWLNDFQFKDRRFGFGGLNNKLFILSHLAITGYEVENRSCSI
ncbi:DUF1642 domain-containing protein [Lactococcus lactis]|uniref:DUF1642 domain-containing protein n=1 Tax=Lactococcus lactis TaxID=1358 RepID=UPI00117A7AFE